MSSVKTLLSSRHHTEYIRRTNQSQIFRKLDTLVKKSCSAHGSVDCCTHCCWQSLWSPRDLQPNHPVTLWIDGVWTVRQNVISTWQQSARLSVRRQEEALYATAPLVISSVNESRHKIPSSWGKWNITYHQRVQPWPRTRSITVCFSHSRGKKDWPVTMPDLSRMRSTLSTLMYQIEIWGQSRPISCWNRSLRSGDERNYIIVNYLFEIFFFSNLLINLFQVSPLISDLSNKPMFTCELDKTIITALMCVHENEDGYQRAFQSFILALRYAYIMVTIFLAAVSTEKTQAKVEKCWILRMN